MNRIILVFASCFMAIGLSYGQKSDISNVVKQLSSDFDKDNTIKKLVKTKKDTLIEQYFLSVLPSNKDSLYTLKRVYKGVNDNQNYQVSFTEYKKRIEQDSTELYKSEQSLYSYDKTKKSKQAYSSVKFYKGIIAKVKN